MSGYISPYPTFKVMSPLNTNCETCGFTVRTKDWNAHQAGKKHQQRLKEIKVREEQERYEASPEYARVKAWRDSADSQLSQNNFEDSNAAKIDGGDRSAPANDGGCKSR
jgi:hypothetical protein